jgi:Flp pilus assembly protein TadD
MNRRNQILTCLLLTGLILFVYYPVYESGFIDLDDDRYVFENRYVRDGLTVSGLKWAFSFNGISYWHPVTWISLMLDSQLYGMSPGCFHLTNLFLHLCNALLLFLIFYRMTGDLFSCLLLSSFFALHPLNVESTVWITERKNVLSCFFWLLSLGSYVGYVEKPAVSTYIPVVIFMLLGIMAKPIVCVLPITLLLLDFWPLARLRIPFSELSDTNYPDRVSVPASHLIREKWPLFCLSAACVLMTVLSLSHHQTITGSVVVPMDLRIANAASAYLMYIWKLFFPFDLAILYPFPDDYRLWQVVLSSTCLLLLTILMIMFSKKRPFLAVGWLWFATTLFPASGLFQSGVWPAMADRFAYIPMMGLLLILCWLLPACFSSKPLSRYILYGLSAISLFYFSSLTTTQIRYWQNSIALFSHTVRVTQNNYLAHNNLGFALFAAGNAAEAMQHYRAALKIKPDFDIAHRNMGVALASSGDDKGALYHYRQALRIRPGNADVHTLVGNLHLRGKDYEAATRSYRRALSSDPSNAGAYNGLGAVSFYAGDMLTARQMFRKSLEADPYSRDAANNLSQVSRYLNRRHSAPRGDAP